MSVVQFSNDVRVELSPQLMPMEQLRAQLGEMVGSPIAASFSWTFPVIRLIHAILASETFVICAAQQQCRWHMHSSSCILVTYDTICQSHTVLPERLTCDSVSSVAPA